jgi:hypothetical protein
MAMGSNPMRIVARATWNVNYRSAIQMMRPFSEIWGWSEHFIHNGPGRMTDWISSSG